MYVCIYLFNFNKKNYIKNLDEKFNFRTKYFSHFLIIL